MKGDNTSGHSKDVKHSSGPQEVHTRVFDLLRQAATQNDPWQLHDSPKGERRQGAGTPKEIGREPEGVKKGSILSLALRRDTHAAALLERLHVSRNREYNNALKEIEDIHRWLGASLKGEDLDAFNKEQKQYMGMAKILEMRIVILSKELISINERLDQSIQRSNNTSKAGIENQIQEMIKARKEQKNSIVTYYDVSMSIIKKHKSALQKFEGLVTNTGESSTHTAPSGEFRRDPPPHFS